MARAAEFNVRPDSFTQTMDIWFDNIFADWAVLDRIRQSKDQLLDVENRVQRNQWELEQDLGRTETELTALKQERDGLVQKA